jgi:hypothetical protein
VPAISNELRCEFVSLERDFGMRLPEAYPAKLDGALDGAD